MSIPKIQRQQDVKMPNNGNITLEYIIGQIWENSTIDSDILMSIKSNALLTKIGREGKLLDSPYLKETTHLISSLEKKFNHIAYDYVLEEKDVTKVYQNIYFFTQISSNISYYISYYKRLLQDWELLLQYFEENLKLQYEEILQSKIKSLYSDRDKEIEKLEKSVPSLKDVSTNEMRFITTKISSIKDNYDSQIDWYTGNKGNLHITSKVKTNPIILEVIRKINIIKGILSYLESRFWSLKEEIMSGKKIIDNLAFINTYVNL